MNVIKIPDKKSCGIVEGHYIYLDKDGELIIINDKGNTQFCIFMDGELTPYVDFPVDNKSYVPVRIKSIEVEYI